MRAYIRRIGYIAVRLCILAIHIYSIYGDIVYISYSILRRLSSILVSAIAESGRAQPRKCGSERKKRGEQQWGLQVVMKCRNCRKAYKHWACGLYAKL